MAAAKEAKEYIVEPYKYDLLLQESEKGDIIKVKYLSLNYNCANQILLSYPDKNLSTRDKFEKSLEDDFFTDFRSTEPKFKSEYKSGDGVLVRDILWKGFRRGIIKKVPTGTLEIYTIFLIDHRLTVESKFEDLFNMVSRHAKKRPYLFMVTVTGVLPTVVDTNGQLQWSDQSKFAVMNWLQDTTRLCVDIAIQTSQYEYVGNILKYVDTPEGPVFTGDLSSYMLYNKHGYSLTEFQKLLELTNIEGNSDVMMPRMFNQLTNKVESMRYLLRDEVPSTPEAGPAEQLDSTDELKNDKVDDLTETFGSEEELVAAAALWGFHDGPTTLDNQWETDRD